MAAHEAALVLGRELCDPALEREVSADLAEARRRLP
jgi:hypothetical protein